MAKQLLALMGSIGRLTPERRALVEREYRRARESGKGDGESAATVLALLTDAERETSNVHPLNALSKPARPPSSATG